MLESAQAHSDWQSALVARGSNLLVARRGDTPEAQAALLAGLQVLSVEESTRAVADMLAEQNISAPRAAAVATRSLAGWASDGRTLQGLMRYAAHADMTDDQFARIVETQLQDVARSGEKLAMAARPRVTAYVRVVSGSACGRCAILAGQVYGSAAAFQRHPRCGCLHVPTDKGRARGLYQSPQEAFDAMSKEQQDRSYTKAGAEAIRLGADPARVINARRGMSEAQMYGRKVLVTTEGMTQRGAAYKAMRDAGSKSKARVMPETILQVADTPAERIRLLKLYGYLL